jgi:CRISPR-associated protein Csy2
MMTIKPYSCAIVLPQLYIQNANAVSGPMTWGFPAMNAFAGFAHALERAVRAAGKDIAFGAVAVVCHKAEPLLADGPSYAPRSFRLTRNPLDSTGAPSAIVEEGRMHITVSIVLTVNGADTPRQDGEEANALAAEVMAHAMSMRIAGGSVVPPSSTQRRPRAPRIYIWHTESKAEVQRKLTRYLMPGFALISRADLLAEHITDMQTSNSGATALDALLDLCALHVKPDDVEKAANEGNVQWAAKRTKPGWLVPIPLGFAAISELHPPGTVKNARDPTVPFCFVESVMSLGEWKSPHQFFDIEDMLWRTDAQPEMGTYLITNNQAS